MRSRPSAGSAHLPARGNRYWITSATVDGTIPSSNKIAKLRLRFSLALGVIGLLATSLAAHAQPLNNIKARQIIDPFYSLFSVATRGDVSAIVKSTVTPDYESCSGYLPSECRNRDATIKAFEGVAKAIPDMRLDIREVLVSGDRVVVLGELTGTPAGNLFGVPHTGKSFRIMTIDIQTIRNGRIAKSFHSENWLSALGQIRSN